MRSIGKGTYGYKMKKPTKKRKKPSRKKNRSEAKTQPVQTEVSPPSEDKRPKVRVIQPPARRESEKRVEEEKGILRYVNVAMQFLRESRSELKKVKWPTRKELLASTAMVIFLVLVISLFLGLIDFGLIKIIRNIVG
jgi:preprotein translocase subunit SecE